MRKEPRPRFRLVGRLRWGLMALLLAVVAPSAEGVTIYTYTGNTFTVFSPAPNPYTTSDYVHGSFTTAAPLAPNLDDADVTGLVLSFVFHDFADDHLPIVSGLPAGFFLTPTISTDGSGNITEWVVGITNGLGTHFIVTTSNNGYSADFDFGDLNAQAGPYAYNSGSPGTWSITPEPSALLLVSGGLVGLTLAGNRRRSHG
ncbi:hypothetical protein MYXO_00438 [Myxococcaceae bacterium]|nr:hypothetical protein MYXO_00438 [Myxococcaceae bacterium]